MDSALFRTLREIARARGSVTVLTGAGISAESGIPTFRGKEGYWTVGSENYLPQEMATRAMFERAPEEVWRWYLYRFGVCADALPNEGHFALVRLEQSLLERFRLVTQNIDGLHRRAGSSVERTYCIHGDAAWVRCADECGVGLFDAPGLERRDPDEPLSPEERARLTCPACGGWLRPHVLWFDEYYDEPNYRAESALEAAQTADLLLVVGTSGATNLPMQMGMLALRRRIPIIDVNPEANPFAELAERVPTGFALRGRAAECLPEIVGELGAVLAG